MTFINKKRRITRTIKFSEVYNDNGNFIGGGVINSTSHVDDDIWIEIMEDPILDQETDNEVISGRQQIHVGGSQKAYEELGVFLLALSQYSPPESGYSQSFELRDREGISVLHLVFHLPVLNLEQKPHFPQIHTVATAHITTQGKVIDTTFNPKSNSKGSLH